VSEEKRGVRSGSGSEAAAWLRVAKANTLSHNWAARQIQNQPGTDSPRQNIEIC
jgi:hypothetical protein